MLSRKTVAVIGLSDEESVLLVTKIANENTTLLYDQDAFLLNNVYSQIKSDSPSATLEKMICPIDASWEADVILLSGSYLKEDGLISQIRKVATGKLILFLLDKTNDLHLDSNFEKVTHLFPFSKVLAISRLDNGTNDCFVVEGRDAEMVPANLTFFTDVNLRNNN